MQKHWHWRSHHWQMSQHQRLWTKLTRPHQRASNCQLHSFAHFAQEEGMLTYGRSNRACRTSSTATEDGSRANSGSEGRATGSLDRDNGRGSDGRTSTRSTCSTCSSLSPCQPSSCVDPKGEYLTAPVPVAVVVTVPVATVLSVVSVVVATSGGKRVSLCPSGNVCTYCRQSSHQNRIQHQRRCRLNMSGSVWNSIEIEYHPGVTYSRRSYCHRK